MKKQLLSLVFSLVICLISSAKTVINETLNTDHPRYLTTENEKKETLDLIKKEKWAKDVFDGLTSRVEKYSSKGPEWLTSRLQMYWKSHATDVYIRGEYYDHATQKECIWLIHH